MTVAYAKAAAEPEAEPKADPKAKASSDSDPHHGSNEYGQSPYSALGQVTNIGTPVTLNREMIAYAYGFADPSLYPSGNPNAIEDPTTFLNNYVLQALNANGYNNQYGGFTLPSDPRTGNIFPRAVNNNNYANQVSTNDIYRNLASTGYTNQASNTNDVYNNFANTGYTNQASNMNDIYNNYFNANRFQANNQLSSTALNTYADSTLTGNRLVPQTLNGFQTSNFNTLPLQSRNTYTLPQAYSNNGINPNYQTATSNQQILARGLTAQQPRLSTQNSNSLNANYPYTTQGSAYSTSSRINQLSPQNANSYQTSLNNAGYRYQGLSKREADPEPKADPEPTFGLFDNSRYTNRGYTNTRRGYPTYSNYGSARRTYPSSTYYPSTASYSNVAYSSPRYGYAYGTSSPVTYPSAYAVASHLAYPDPLAYSAIGSPYGYPAY